VEITGLTPWLMKEQMLLATLEQAGLEKEVVGIVLPDHIDGTQMVVIKLKSKRAAEKCKEHFDGRTWGSGMVVAKVGPKMGASRQQESRTGRGGMGQVVRTSLAAAPPAQSAQEWTAPRSRLNMHTPAYVHVPGLEPFAAVRVKRSHQVNRKGSANSEASTNVSDEEHLLFQEDLQKLLDEVSVSTNEPVWSL
jgi:hypothetical protein